MAEKFEELKDKSFWEIDQSLRDEAKCEVPFVEEIKTEVRQGLDEDAKRSNRSLIVLSVVTLLLSVIMGFVGGFLAHEYLDESDDRIITTTEVVKEVGNTKTVNEESAIIDVVKNNQDSVVSIVVTKDLPIYENYDNFWDSFLYPDQNREQIGTEEQQIGAGTGFIASKQGYIITNKHVVSDADADYTVILNDGTKVDAQVLARDVILDIAFIKIEADEDLNAVSLGDSDNLQVGQTAVAIGYSLGEFSNSVSKGIISGLERDIVAADQLGGNSELLEGIIQTDASINFGNSGGPLLDINGNVIGVNVARADAGENVGFAIPINSVKPILKSVIENGEINRPFLGVMYIIIDQELAEKEDLAIDYGAYIMGNGQESAVLKNSAADKAGLEEGDIILEVGGQKIDADNDLRKLIQTYSIGDKVNIKILRGGEEKEIEVELQPYPKN